MFPVLALFAAIGMAAYALNGTRTPPTRAARARSRSAILNPRTERPWCEMRPGDFDASDLRNRVGLVRWARCSTTTAEDIALVGAAINEAIDGAPSDGEAVALAGTRDAVVTAFRDRA